MEKKFYTDNFEYLLKEKLDEFKMIPSKRIWHSIYNDLHPSKKWPSITITLFLITTLILVDYFNLTPANKRNNSTTTNTNSLITISDNKILKNSFQNNNNNNNNIVVIKDEIASNNILTINKKKQGNINPKKKYVITVLATANNLNEVNNKVAVNGISAFSNNDNPIKASVYKISKKIDASIINSEVMEVMNDKAENEYKHNNAVFENAAIPQQSIHSPLPDNDKAWIDNYALYNTSRRKSWKGNAAYTLYATPNICYRKLTNRNKYNTPDNNELNNLNQYPGFGIETGIGVIYALAKNIRIKSSLQFNYTNYAITALENDHPILTTLRMQDINTKYLYLEPRVSTLSNVLISQSSIFHNKTYQLSIPIGIEFKIASKENFKWYASTSIQPTYVIGGDAHLISDDKKNYVTDASMIRKWNINTSIGVLASYQIEKGTQLQFEPQYRYQLMSTYKKTYSIAENIYHWGIKLGVVKDF